MELGAQAVEQGAGFGGGEVADAGADVEREDSGVGRTLDGEGFGDVVGDARADGDLGYCAFDTVAGGFECGGADVDGLIEDGGLAAGERAEEDAGLGSGAGAELGDGNRRVEGEEDLIGVGGEEVALGAGEVVLGECGDLLEEVGAGFVVEEPRGEGLGGSGEAATGFGGDGFIDDG
jgi:hypothetical protein